MKTKTYSFFIDRVVTRINENGKEVREKITFPCKVNAAVPFNHKMLH